MINKTLVEAREWLDTRWRAGQSQKRVSCDCVGLIVGVVANLGFKIELENYSQIPDGDSLTMEVRKYAEEIPAEERRPGDVLLFNFSSGGYPSHVGFLSENDYFIHADARSRIRKVVEVPLGYWENRIVGVYRLPV